MGAPNNKYIDNVEVWQDADGQWRIRAKSSNGEIILSSEAYVDQDYAVDVAHDLGVPVKIVVGEE